jgi:hypothetical protein
VILTFVGVGPVWPFLAAGPRDTCNSFITSDTLGDDSYHSGIIILPAVSDAMNLLLS